MKNFFRDYSYYSVKMFINQIAISLLGMTLSMVFMKSESYTGQVISSVCAVLFYLFLIYYMTWEVGHKDGVAAGHGKLRPSPLNGLYMSLLANAINIILAVFICFGIGIGSAAVLIEGMYAGIIIAVSNGGAAPWWIFFVIILPAPVIATVSYYFGLKDIRFTPLFNEKSTEKPEKDRKGK